MVALQPAAWFASPRSNRELDSARVEYPSPDSAANPYLAFAVILAAGLAGVLGGYELPKEDGRTAPAPRVARRRGLDMVGSTLLHETLGDHLVEWFLRNKRAEWAAYRGRSHPSNSTVPAAPVNLDVVLCVSSCGAVAKAVASPASAAVACRRPGSTRSRPRAE